MLRALRFMPCEQEFLNDLYNTGSHGFCVLVFVCLVIRAFENSYNTDWSTLQSTQKTSINRRLRRL